MLWPRVKKGWFVFIERLLHWLVDPRLRALALRSLGAKIGDNVRVYEVSFINLDNGFRNLELADNVHVGHGCLLDLHDRIILGAGATLSPLVCVLTHADPGSSHGSPLCECFPPIRAPVYIGPYSWVGANTTILAGSELGEKTVVGAASLVKGILEGGAAYGAKGIYRYV